MWLLIVAQSARAVTVAEAYPPPPGAVAVPGDAFGDWLSQLDLRAEDEPVRTFRGDVVRGHSARVVDLPMVPGDLQQCADALIRLRAEWLRETGGQVVFHATSGDAMPWSRYATQHAYEEGSGLAWGPGGRDWEGYLSQVFTWAGTRSLHAYDTVPAGRPLPGSVLVDPGSPGHAVILLGVARRGEQTLVLVGESYMPAQDFHLELGPERGWWVWDDGVDIGTWDMPGDGLRAWKE